MAIKVGDMVRVIGTYPGRKDLTGKTGIITRPNKGLYDWVVEISGVTFAFYTHELEVIEMKKLSEKTVKAVGGCQAEALVALLKEMGYEIETKGRVRAGMRGDIPQLNLKDVVIAPKGTHELDVTSTRESFSYWDAKGNLHWERFEYLRTKDGHTVIGYEE